MNKFPRLSIQLYAVIGLILCAIIAYSGYMIHINFNKNDLLIQQTERTLTDIIYFDEVLTMSARMAAFTGDKTWETRYRAHEKKLNEALQLTQSVFHIDEDEIEAKITQTANAKLVAMENESFEHVRKGEFAAAKNILMSPAYYEQKNMYALGQQKLTERLEDYKRKLNNHNISMLISIISACCLLVALSIISIFINFKTIQKSYDQEKLALEYKRLASLGTLSAGMAHEINNALQPILGLSEVLSKTFANGNEETKTYAEYTKAIHSSAIHAKHIVENVLASAKGKQTQMEQWEASHLLTECLSFASQILPTTIDLRQDFSAFNHFNESYKILANKTDITQILSNILKNASQAMGNRGAITTSVKFMTLDKNISTKYGVYEGDYISMSIEDMGHGMDAKTMSNIFNPFFTTKTDEDGTGLGLSVAYGIMQQMGGNILVTSKVNKGTTFKLLFPLQS